MYILIMINNYNNAVNFWYCFLLLDTMFLQKILILKIKQNSHHTIDTETKQKTDLLCSRY